MGRRKKRRGGGDVELNLAAMLDMAFQLLTFFILTFKPAPVEGQVNLRLPPPIPITVKGTEPIGKQEAKPNEMPQGVNTLVINIFNDLKARDPGKAIAYAVGEAQVGTLDQLNNKLQEIFSDSANPFDQVIIQVPSRVRYEELMKVIEVCTKQKLPDGSKLAKLSFVELPQGEGG